MSMKELKKYDNKWIENRLNYHLTIKKEKREMIKKHDREKSLLFLYKIIKIDSKIKTINFRIINGSHDAKKLWIKLHYLRMLQYYTYLKFYNDNNEIKREKNAKLLSYFKEKLSNYKEINLKAWL